MGAAAAGHPRVQVFFVEGLDWQRVALMHTGSHQPREPGLVERSQILSFGLSTVVFLCVVAAQLAVQLVGSRLRLPLLGNLEDPRDAYLCARPPDPVAGICARARGCFFLGSRVSLPCAALGT